MKRILLLLACVSLLAACQSGSRERHHEGDIVILRADQLLFGTPEDQLGSELTRVAGDYHCPPLFDIPLSDPSLGAMLADFISTPGLRDIYDTVQAHYGNLVWLERQLSKAMASLKKAYGDNPEVPLECTKAIAHINGSLNYDYRVAASDGVLLISIDQYVLPYFEQYGYFGEPQYIVSMCDSAFLLTDCLSALAQQVIPVNEMSQLLDYMIAEGKTLYMLDLACPKMADRVKMRYSEEQMEWMRHNEANVWAYLVQHKLLFETNMAKYHNLMDEAPKTNAFGNESAPRTAQYIGWQIVRQYAKKTGCSLQELLNETNANTILNLSGYRP